MPADEDDQSPEIDAGTDSGPGLTTWWPIAAAVVVAILAVVIGIAAGNRANPDTGTTPTTSISTSTAG